jgi:hypothetical protein
MLLHGEDCVINAEITQSVRKMPELRDDLQQRCI